MIDTPIFAATMLDLGFDPETVTPTQLREERRIANQVWAEKTWRKIRSASAGTLARQRAKGAA